MWEQYAGLLQGDYDPEAVVYGTHLGDADDLNKALTAGSAVDNPGVSPGEGFPLRTESLDSTLYVTTYSVKHAKFWRALAKDKAYNTVEEYNRLEAYGSGEAAFIGEGELPAEDDSTYSRNYTRIKYMGTTRRVTHQATVIRTAHGNAVAREQVNGTAWLIRELERSLFNGDEAMVPEQFDGLEKSLVSAYKNTRAEDDQLLGYADPINVIDKRGEPLSEADISDLAERVSTEPNWGEPSDLWIPPGVYKDLSKVMYPRARYDLPAPKDGKTGIVINTVATPFGDITLNSDLLMPTSTIISTEALTGAGKPGIRPAPPTVGVVTSPVYAGANTTYWGANDVGTYIWRVVAGSRHGRSAPVNTAAHSVAAGDTVQIPVTDNGPGTTYYDVYRTKAGGTSDTARHIMRVRKTGPSQTIVDMNRFLPGCQKGFMLTQAPDILKWKQLAPFTKISLAIVDLSVRWMQVLYGALQVQQPRKCGMFINVGQLDTGAVA